MKYPRISISSNYMQLLSNSTICKNYANSYPSSAEYVHHILFIYFIYHYSFTKYKTRNENRKNWKSP